MPGRSDDPGAQGPLTEPLTPVCVCRPQNHRLISESLLGPGQQQSETPSQLPCPLLPSRPQAQPGSLFSGPQTACRWLSEAAPGACTEPRTPAITATLGKAQAQCLFFEAGNMRSPRSPVGALGVPVLSCNKMSSIITTLSIPHLSSDFPGQSHCSKEDGAGRESSAQQSCPGSGARGASWLSLPRGRRPGLCHSLRKG